MAKEWVLNSATNRFQLNFKRNVGATSESIRKCSPKTLDDWAEYYYEQVKSREHIDGLGESLYNKIQEVLIPEMNSITEDECKNYLHQLVINRTYDGYTREIESVYEILQGEIKNQIKPAVDEWDRKYNVDYYIQISELYIGIQIKPVPKGIQLPQIYKEYTIQKKSHSAFTAKFGGNVFYIFSGKEDGRPFILNKEVIKKIKQEIKRLESR